MGQKNNSCPCLCQKLTNFQNSFIGTFSRKSAIKRSLLIPSHLNCTDRKKAYSNGRPSANTLKRMLAYTCVYFTARQCRFARARIRSCLHCHTYTCAVWVQHYTRHGTRSPPTGREDLGVRTSSLQRCHLLPNYFGSCYKDVMTSLLHITAGTHFKYYFLKKLAPHRTGGRLLLRARLECRISIFIQVQSHGKQNLGKISKIRPKQI